MELKRNSKAVLSLTSQRCTNTVLRDTGSQDQRAGVSENKALGTGGRFEFCHLHCIAPAP